MPIRMEVDVQGIDAWRLRLSNPAAVRDPMRRFLRRSANVVRPAVMANIPVYTGNRLRRDRKGGFILPGAGRRSVRIKMQAGRFQVRVLSRLFYVRFLEHGTKRGIVARLMFARAAQSSKGQVQQFAREMVREILARVNSG